MPWARDHKTTSIRVVGYNNIIINSSTYPPVGTLLIKAARSLYIQVGIMVLWEAFHESKFLIFGACVDMRKMFLCWMRSSLSRVRTGWSGAYSRLFAVDSAAESAYIDSNTAV